MYAQDPRVNKSKAATKKVCDLVTNDDFWYKLKALRDLFEPLHENQKTSESNHSSIDKVYPRWIATQAHLEEFAKPEKFPFAADIREYLDRKKHGWSSRFERQIQVPHLLAYILDPLNREG
jgi:hypothetical protein